MRSQGDWSRQDTLVICAGGDQTTDEVRSSGTSGEREERERKDRDEKRALRILREREDGVKGR